jgi:hypothetical protein
MTHDCREKVRPGPVERLAWSMHDYRDVEEVEYQE